MEAGAGVPGILAESAKSMAREPRGPSDEMIAAEASEKRVAVTIEQLEVEAAELNEAIANMERTLSNAQRLRNSAVARLDSLRGGPDSIPG